MSRLVSTSELRRAQLTLAAQRSRQELVAKLDALLQAVEPADVEPITPSRLNGLLNSMAWHQRRPTAQLRLKELADELRRLGERAAEGSAERRLYAALLELLGLERLKTPDEQQMLRALRIEGEEEEHHWMRELRLLQAQAVIQTLVLLAGTRRLRNQLQATGGALRWR